MSNGDGSGFAYFVIGAFCFVALVTFVAQRHGLLDERTSNSGMASVSSTARVAQPKATGAEGCRDYAGTVREPRPQLASNTDRLNVRAGPGTEHPVVETLTARGWRMLVHQSCGEWARIVTDTGEGAALRDVVGWVHLPLTCTPRNVIRGGRFQRQVNAGDGSEVLREACNFELRWTSSGVVLAAPESLDAPRWPQP